MLVVKAEERRASRPRGFNATAQVQAMTFYLYMLQARVCLSGMTTPGEDTRNDLR